MNVTVNGRDISFDGDTIEELLYHLGTNVSGCAIAVGDSIVPSSQWGTQALEHGCRVTIIRATQGG